MIICVIFGATTLLLARGVQTNNVLISFAVEFAFGLCKAVLTGVFINGRKPSVP